MVGPMAQDLERGPLGDTLVKDTPQGKMVDTGRLTMVNSSAIAEMQRQLEALGSAKPDDGSVRSRTTARAE